jgi:hypothetical protein
VKTLCVGFLFILAAESSYAIPSSQVIQSCLRTEAVTPDVRYVDINPKSFNEEEDKARQTTSTTISFHGKEVGMWKTIDSKNFGVVYRDRKIPTKRVIKLGSHVPSAFNPYTAQWGEARDAKHTYVCITFNFEGLGESGSFQNIRGLYLIETTSTGPKVFYTVGDIRQ